jgi:hypothetical protein
MLAIRMSSRYLKKKTQILDRCFTVAISDEKPRDARFSPGEEERCDSAIDDDDNDGQGKLGLVHGPEGSDALAILHVGKHGPPRDLSVFDV